MKNLLNWVTVIGIIVTIIFIVLGIKIHDCKLIAIALLSAIVSAISYTTTEIKYENK